MNTYMPPTPRLSQPPSSSGLAPAGKSSVSQIIQAFRRSFAPSTFSADRRVSRVGVIQLEGPKKPELAELLVLIEKINQLKQLINKKDKSQEDKDGEERIKGEISRQLKQAADYLGTLEKADEQSQLIEDMVTGLDRVLKKMTNESAIAQSIFNLSVNLQQILDYREDIKEMGVYGSYAEAEFLAGYLKMQVPVFIRPRNRLIQVALLGVGRPVIPGGWGLLHSVNHYIAIQYNSQNLTEAPQRHETNPDGNCLFHAMLLVRYGGAGNLNAKVPDLAAKIQTLRNKASGRMTDENITYNIQEMILFGNGGRSGKKTGALVAGRRQEGFIDQQVSNWDEAYVNARIGRLPRSTDRTELHRLRDDYLAKKEDQPKKEDTRNAFQSLKDAIIQAEAAAGRPGYDEEAVKYFLVRKGSLVNEKLHNRVDLKRLPKDEPPPYMYHMTSLKNLLSIQNKGLDPNLGGKEGGSCEIGGNKELQDRSKKHTAGKIAAGISNDIVSVYIHQRGSWAELVAGNPSFNFEIMLRFKSDVARDWEEDPEHLGAWHTRTAIGPDSIEALLAEGWKPIRDLDLDGLMPLKSDKPGGGTIRLAFSGTDMLTVFPHRAPQVLNDYIVASGGKVKRKDTGGLLDALKDGALTGMECEDRPLTYIGVTAHPIGEPENWLYVFDIPAQEEELDPRREVITAAAAREYNTKIGDPGWGG